MASMYSAKVMEHFANPHNVGEIPDANGVGEVGNPKCGDIMRMYLKIENNVIVDVKFLTFGCGAAIATSSMATDLIKGKTIDEALKLTNKAVVEALEGLPPIKVHCSVLAEQAVKAALSDYYRRQGIDPEPIVALGGMLSVEAKAIAAEAGVELVDYFAREELTIRNAIPTAEGCIGILMKERSRTLWGSSILLTGFGPVGQALGVRLAALGAQVTAAARRPAQRALAESFGLRSIPIDRLGR